MIFDNIFCHISVSYLIDSNAAVIEIKLIETEYQHNEVSTSTRRTCYFEQRAIL